MGRPALLGQRLRTAGAVPRRSSTTTASAGWTTGAIRPTRSSAPDRPDCTCIATRSDSHREYRPRFEAGQAFARSLGAPKVFDSLEDAIDRGSYFVGSPQQVIEQIHRYHDALGHEVQHTAGIGSPDDPTARAGIELFATEVMPVIRRGLPDRLWDVPPDRGSGGTCPDVGARRARRLGDDAQAHQLREQPASGAEADHRLEQGEDEQQPQQRRRHHAPIRWRTNPPPPPW